MTSTELVAGHTYKLEGVRGTWIYKYKGVGNTGKEWLTFYGPVGQNQMYRSFDVGIGYKPTQARLAVPMMGPSSRNERWK